MEKEIVNNDDIEVAISESKEFKDKLSSIYLKHKDSSINFLLSMTGIKIVPPLSANWSE